MNKIYVKINDKYRAILTETTPSETPIIFSNEGLYKLLKISKNNQTKTVSIEDIIDQKPTKPFKYYIKKDDSDFRIISLLHPSSQIKLSKFIYENQDLITYYCNQSDISIRYPYKQTSSFYIKNKNLENIYKLKGENKSSYNIDIYSLYSPSFFSYKKYDRIYKFINSKEFVNLESRFGNLITIDIAKCFHCIYTHSISWATKNKEYIKNNLGVKHFSDKFDIAIREGNYNETHGIPIGPEISRIFAEIILQRIDKNIISSLKRNNITYNKDYVIRRYVDDLYIFSKNKKILNDVKNSVIYELSLYNLHINKNKTKESERPFITSKSMAIQDLYNIINELSVDFIASILNHDRYKIRFIERVKTILKRNNLRYHDINSFIISALSKRLRKYISNNTHKINSKAINMIFEINFYLFSIYSNANIGNVLCGDILHIYENYKRIENINTITLNLYQIIYNLKDLINKDDPIPIEYMNIILMTKIFNKEFRLPPEFIKETLLSKGDKSDYFSIISAVFYLENNDKNLTKEIINIIFQKIKNEEKNANSSEITHLILDMAFCPFIEDSEKRKMLKELEVAEKNIPLIIRLAKKNHYAFVNWRNFSAYNILFKKELAKRILRKFY